MVKFVPNPLGIALIARTPLMSAAMVGRANDVAATASAIAPVGDGTPGGHYKDQIAAAPIVERGLAGGRVNAWKFTSGWIEFGNSKVAAHAPLRTACDANGLTLSEGRS
jgi:hypothetical protein